VKGDWVIGGASIVAAPSRRGVAFRVADQAGDDALQTFLGTAFQKDATPGGPGCD
jgi:hypothetical protein